MKQSSRFLDRDAGGIIFVELETYRRFRREQVTRRRYDWADTGPAPGHPKKRIWKGTPPDRGTRVQIIKPGSSGRGKGGGATKPPPKGKPVPHTIDQVRQLAQALHQGVTVERIDALALAMMDMKAPQLAELKKEFGLKARGREDLAKRITEQIKSRVKGKIGQSSLNDRIPDGSVLEKGEKESLGPPEQHGGTSLDISKITVDGKSYFVKATGDRPYVEDNPDGPRNEEVVSHLASILGVNVPVSRRVTMDGKEKVATEWLNGKSFYDFDDEDQLNTRLLQLGLEEVTRHVVLDYLCGNPDSHLGNYMLVGPNNLIYGIDKEFAFNYDASHEFMIRHHELASLWRRATGGQEFVPDKTIIKDMVIQGPKLLSVLKDQKMHREVMMMKRLLDKLNVFQASNHLHTLSDLGTVL